MKRTLLLFVLFLSFYYSNAQFIDNKLDLSMGYGPGKFGGDEMLNVDGFIAPALYSNFDNSYGISIKMIFLKKQRLSFGASMNYVSGSEWNTDEYADYLNSKVVLFSFSPIVQIHNKPVASGFLNRFTIYFDAAPTIGFSKTSLSNPLFDIYNGDYLIQQPSGSSDLFYGLRGALGIQGSITQTLGLFLESSAGYYRVNSGLYSDNHFINYRLEAGLTVKLIKNQRYYY